MASRHAAIIQTKAENLLAPLFACNLPFGNKRYRHYDLAAKFLLITEKDAIVDTKKVYLDNFVVAWKKRKISEVSAIDKKTRRILDQMSCLFVKADGLLRSVGMITLYFHLFRIALSENWANQITREKLIAFDKMREKNRVLAEKDITKADYDLLEFDRYVQAPNDAYATELRLQVLFQKVFKRKLPSGRAGTRV